MNQKFRKINPEGLLFFDIETVRKQDVLDVDSTEFSLFQYKNRDKTTGALLPYDEVVSLYEKSAALFPPHNKIVCISVGYIRNNSLVVKAITGDQKSIIEEFYNLLNTRNLIPCGANIIAFDMPIVRMKAFEEKVEVILNDKFSDVGQKPWTMEDNFVDIMALFKGTYYNALSLNELAYMSGVPSSKDDIDGSQVSQVYYREEGGIKRIATYCNKDVICTAKIFLAMQGKHDFIQEVIDKTGVVEEVKQLGLMEKIAATKTITEEQQIELITKFKKVKKAEKKDAVTLIRIGLQDNAEYYEPFLKTLEK
jgi:predicted PolB exonuclease-like 3'-5' exonuclease